MATDEPVQLLTQGKQKTAKKKKAKLEIVAEGKHSVVSKPAGQVDKERAEAGSGNGAALAAAAAASTQQPAEGAGATQRSSHQRAEDNRCATRFPLKIEIGYNSEHNFYTGFLENISSGGLFVATHQPVSLGDRIELSFTVPGLERTCTAACAVRWLREYNPLAPDTIPGMGLQFQDLDAEARAAIDLFIKHREPIFFDDE